MNQMTDSEILARLIYRAFVLAPAGMMADCAANVPFPDAMELYSRTRIRELIDDGELEPANDIYRDPDPEPEPEPTAEPPNTHTHTEAGTNDGGELTPRLFAGYGAGEKREIYARLMAFVAAHGLGTRRKIAEVSNGALQLSDVQDMTAAKRVPLSKWRVAAAAMDWIEEQEQENGTD